MYEIRIRRAYDKKRYDDGYCMLVDRLWPRGIKKEDLSYSWWPKDIAPSLDLRKCFNHEPQKFAEFKRQYKQELDKNTLKSEFLDKISAQLKKHHVTFIYAAKDKEHNHALVLNEWARTQLK